MMTVAENTAAKGGGDELVRAGMHWYVLRVASNREDQVRDALERKIKIEKLEESVGRILVPTQKEKKSPAIWAAVPEGLPGPEMIAQPKPMAMVMEPVAVNGKKFTADVLDAAMVAAQKSRRPIAILVDNADFFRTFEVAYYDGPRYPHLVRVEGKEDQISAVLAPRAK